MEDGNLIPWARRSARVGLRVNWSFSGEGCPGLLPSAMSYTGRDTTNWSGRFRFTPAAIRLMGWLTASRTGSIPNPERGGEMKNFAAGSGKKQVPPLRFAPVGMTELWVEAWTAAPTICTVIWGGPGLELRHRAVP